VAPPAHLGPAGAYLVDLQQVAALGPLRVVEHQALRRVGLAALDLVGDGVGVVREVDA
jgi:hypothetical protein